MWRRKIGRRHITGQASGWSGTGSAEGSGQESVVDQVLVGGLVAADPAATPGVCEELLQRLRDVVPRTRPSDDDIDVPDELRREVAVDDRLQPAAGRGLRSVDGAQHHAPVRVAAELV